MRTQWQSSRKTAGWSRGIPAHHTTAKLYRSEAIVKGDSCPDGTVTSRATPTAGPSRRHRVAVRVAFDYTAAAVSSGGVGRVTAEQAVALSRLDSLEIHLVSAGAPRSSSVGRAVAGVRREAYWYPFALPRQLRRLRPDVVHFPAPLGSLRSGSPVVLTVYDVLPWRYPELFTKLNAAHQRHLVTRLTARADMLIASSAYTRDELTELLGIPTDRIRVVPMGVDPRFRPCPNPATVRRLTGLKEPYVIAVGTLEPRKNLVSIIAAMEALADRGLDVPLVVVGGRGWRDQELRARLATTTARVIPVGRVSDDDLVSLYTGARCLVFPSLYEGFGLPILEAMSCGVPVVASNRASLPEVVGDAGILVEPLDVHAIAESVAGIVDDDEHAADLTRRGLEWSAAFTWERTALLTRDVYRLVARG